MDAVFIDNNGNKKNFLYQYDVGQTFVVEDFEYEKAPKAQFSIKSIKTMPSVSSRLVDGDLYVSIPDMLLTYGENIIAYLYIEDGLKGSTVETIFISVIPRKRPADYIYTDEMFAQKVNGSVITEKCGIAEVAEWVDGNTGNENRCFSFVSARYDKYDDKLLINKATSINDVYGVSMHEVGFASNCDEGKLSKNGTLLPQYAYVCVSGFATVEDDGICKAGDVCIPNNNGIAVKSTNLVGYKVVDRVDNNHILIFVDQSMQTINNMQVYVSDFHENFNDHKNDKLNPHAVTKAQVGLGNVPDVVTNDQTPTYTEATTLEKLSSGEKLSIAFGKISKAITDFIAHLANVGNPHSVTKAQVGLGNADNTSDIDKPVSTAQSTAISNAKTEVQNNLDTHMSDVENPHAVTAHQVGAYTQEETDKKIAGLVDTAPEALNTLNELSAALGDDPNFATTMSTELGKKATKDELDAHANRIDNPHSVTKEQVGLGHCDNTSDVNKPISTAQAEAIADAKKAGTDAQSAIDNHMSDEENPHKVTKTQVGLSDVDNTSDINKPISTATQGALDKKADIVDGKVPVEQLPTGLAPGAHADTHKTGGSDALSYSDFGAAAEVHDHNDLYYTKQEVDAHTHERNMQNLVFFVDGTQNDPTNTWTGILGEIKELYDGLSIIYWVPHSSTGNVTLELILGDGSYTGNIPCYVNGGEYLSSDIPGKTVVMMVYREDIYFTQDNIVSGWWVMSGNGFYGNADVKQY